MKVVKLEVQNLMKLRLAEVTPDPAGGLVVVAGRNGQGKSTLLNAIWIGLLGAKAMPARPVRDGEDKATIRIEFDDMIVTRTIGVDGSTKSLKVEDRDGKRYASPQALLDTFVSKVAFDPEAFATMAPKARLELLRELVGLDFTDLDKERGDLFAERTLVNREVKRLEAELSGMPPLADAPDEEVSVSGLAEELRAAEVVSREAEKLSAEATRQAAMAKGTRAEIAAMLQQIADLTAEAENAENMAAGLSFEATEAAAKVPDIAAIRERLVGAEGVNRAVRARQQRIAIEAKLDDARVEASVLTDRLGEIDAEKHAALEGAKYPLPGLRLSDEGVLLDGQPFEQASDAERLRASVAIGIAMNPKVRVMLVRRGSLLDADSMALLETLASEKDAQVWVERVGTADAISFVIEDGSIVESEET